MSSETWFKTLQQKKTFVSCSENLLILQSSRKKQNVRNIWKKWYRHSDEWGDEFLLHFTGMQIDIA